MLYTPLLLLVALAASTEGAALVRFINTVPTRSNTPSIARMSAANPGVAGAWAAPTTPVELRVYGENADSAGLAAIHNRFWLAQDRVGLLYYGDASNQVASPTVVQTMILEANDISTSTGPFAWYHAMPTLRAYHLFLASELTGTSTGVPAPAVDLPFGSAGTVNTITNMQNEVDYYESSQLRADGVGTYLSFAPGSYSYAAYSVMSDAAITGSTKSLAYSVFPNSRTSFTLADNKVYTILAVGDGAYLATIPRTGATVRLVLIEESVAPTTFGKSAIRFVHAISSVSSSSIDVYSNAGLSTALVTGIPFGGVSNYVDVAPATTAEYPVATGNAVIPAVTGAGVQREVRAGSRVTVVCFQNNLASTAIACRGFPSRAVAYVRLIADTTGLSHVVQGKAGAQKLSDTKLSLYASYEYPRPEVLAEGSQVMASASVTGAAATLEGLYPVVVNVAAGTASGYGEVHVPLHIMDFALRPVIGQAKITGAATVTSQTGAFLATAAVLDGHYWYAPLLKRVHFVVKTDGFATLGGRTTTRRNIIPLPMVLDTNTKAGVGIATGNVATTNPEFNVIASAMTIDKYVEAGQMYSFSVSGGFGKTDDGTVYTNLLTTSTVYQEAATVSFAFNLDRSLSKIAATTIAASSAVLQLYPVAVSGFAADTGAGGVTPAVYAYPQDISRSRVYYWDSGVTTGDKAGFHEFGSNTVTVTPVGGGSSVTLTASQGTGTGVIATSATAPIYNPTSFDNNDNVVSAGSYSLTFSQPSAASATFTPGTAGGTAVAAAVFAAVEACYHYIPSGSITAAPGVITDIMVFGAASCFTPVQFTTGQKTTVGSSATGNPTSDQSKLTLKAVVRQSAAASGHSPFSSTSSRSVADVAVAGAEVPLYNGAAASSVSILFAVVMAFIAALAF